MLSSFFSGISGLMSNSHSINVVGNNIANVNTAGYKTSRTTFEDVLYQSINGASGTSQVGRGSTLSSVDTMFSQGSFESTSEPTDLAIGGEGFFMVKSGDDGTTYYTRAGQFRFDKDGNMINPTGYVLQGREIDRTTHAPVGVNEDIVISQEPSEPRATETIGMVVNLQSNADWKGTINTFDTAGTSIAAVADGGAPIDGDYTLTTNGTTLTLTIAERNAGGALTGNEYTYTGTIAISTAYPNWQATGIDVTTAAALTNGTQHFTVTGGVVSALAAAGTSISNTTASSGKYPMVGDYTAVVSGGTTLTVTVKRRGPDGLLTGDETTYTGTIAANTTYTDWQNSGLDITTAAALANGTQTFDISGFQYQYISASQNPTATSDYSSSITVYDSLGQAHVVNVYFRKAYETTTGQGVWEWMTVLDANDSVTNTDTLVDWGELTFNNTGALVSGGDPVAVTFDFSQGAIQDQVIELVFGSGSGGGTSTQYPIASTTNFQTQDGYPPGTLTSITVSAEGIISGHYSNGQILDLYLISLADFNNAQGLKKEGGNLYSETLASGPAYTNAPGEGGLGKINPNSLEQSNVDLATEFVKMIIAQRGFQANSRVITTTDEVLQELMNLKR